MQTNDDAVERDVQTEEVEDRDKWTQHPAEDQGGVGGEFDFCSCNNDNHNDDSKVFGPYD